MPRAFPRVFGNVAPWALAKNLRSANQTFAIPAPSMSAPMSGAKYVPTQADPGLGYMARLNQQHVPSAAFSDHRDREKTNPANGIFAAPTPAKVLGPSCWYIYGRVFDVNGNTTIAAGARVLVYNWFTKALVAEGVTDASSNFSIHVPANGPYYLVVHGFEGATAQAGATLDTIPPQQCGTAPVPDVPVYVKDPTIAEPTGGGGGGGIRLAGQGGLAA